ncbi:hypothetical protein OCK74_07125 [Chitinophagaceae bacterium LB-8]|uniref:Uncharacterized protein n=1 Tax=Paraflavisolibacter caeni TaxID=2982496 RepID=A0A9X2XTE9_9BACT|nr:hypothetical protein [Paraflavisolibacter caeni]MCU7548884.1 hypothetical protein [Paraflavisolibacter caeni]
MMETSGAFLLGRQKTTICTIDRSERLQQRLLLFSFVNLFLTSCLGILLRTFPYLSLFPLNYKNVLHGHSHFAFGGWIMPVLLALVLKCFPELRQTVAFKHWRNIAVLMLISAYGMLISFPLQGYKAVSISFSTLSLISGFYLAMVSWKASRILSPSLSQKFLNAGLFYHVLSSAGPFATAPLIILGKAGTPVYYDVIYFFLHFQYNGFFTFTVLALIYKMLERQNVSIKSGQKVFLLLQLACIPAYFLSVLWHGPSLIFNIIGGVAAGLQVIAMVFLIRDARSLQWKNRFIKLLFTLAISAFILKNILQFMGAFPYIASISYGYRNFVIAYLHLVLLGFISLFSFAATFQSFAIRITRTLCLAVILFLAAFFTTELLLASSALSALLKYYFFGITPLLLICSCPFPLGILIMNLELKTQLATPQSHVD